MLKLVLFAAALAAVTSTPIYRGYMPSPFLPSPYAVPFGYTGPVPVPYLRTGIPTPFVGGDPYSDAVAAEDQEPILPFTSVPTKPVYLTPEQHHMYLEALKSHDPLGFAEQAQAEQIKKKEAQYKQ